MNADHKITWIASFPRSGNTWVRSLITAYANGGEVNINSIMQTGDKHPGYYEGMVQEPIKQWLPVDQALLKPAAMLRMLEDCGGNMMLKTHDCNVDISGVAQIPHALTRAAIYIVRDPRDVVLSFKKHFKCANLNEAIDSMLNPETIMRQPHKGLFLLQFSWQLHLQSWLRDLPYPVFMLRYEDLQTDTFDLFSDLVRFLKMDYDADLVRKSIQACRFATFQRQEKKDGFREGVGSVFFDKGMANRWKTELAPKYQQRIVSACAKEMKSMGYLS